MGRTSRKRIFKYTGDLASLERVTGKRYEELRSSDGMPLVIIGLDQDYIDKFWPPSPLLEERKRAEREQKYREETIQAKTLELGADGIVDFQLYAIEDIDRIFGKPYYMGIPVKKKMVKEK